MQRLFSMFPQGGPGVALLLLRISVAAILAMTSVNRPLISSHFFLAGPFLIGLLLVIGLFTPFFSFIAGAFGLANLLIGGHPGPLVVTVVVTSILNSAALALLGPGAYSLDARLFGRRVIVVPPSKDPNQD